MRTQLIVIRHGETEWNATGRIQGHRDVALNDRGYQQAEAVAERLADEAFDALYSSDLLRAKQTAEAIAGRTGHSIGTDVRLREWDLGVLAGLTWQEAQIQHREAAAIYREGRVDAVVPGGESIRQRFLRVTAAMEDLATRHRGGRLVVVTHGGPLGDCYVRASGGALEEPRDFELFNAGLNVFEITSTQWALVRWGEIDHLQHIGTLGNWEGRS